MEIFGSSTFCPLARIVSRAILAVNREQSLSLGELRYNAWRQRQIKPLSKKRKIR
jgi:hypothetical protein